MKKTLGILDILNGAEVSQNNDVETTAINNIIFK